MDLQYKLDYENNRNQLIVTALHLNSNFEESLILQNLF